MSSGWDTLPFLSHPDEIANFDFHNTRWPFSASVWNSRIRTQRISKLATLASHLHTPKEGAATAINLRGNPDQLVLPSVQLLDDLQPFRVLAWNSDRIRVEYEFKDRLGTMQNHIPNFHDFAAELFPRRVDLSVNGAVMSDCRLGLWKGNLHLPRPPHP